MVQQPRPKQRSSVVLLMLRAGRIDSYALLNIYGGYDINDNYRIKAGVNNATDLEYIATRHPHGARAGAPLTAYIKAIANF